MIQRTFQNPDNGKRTKVQRSKKLQPTFLEDFTLCFSKQSSIQLHSQCTGFNRNECETKVNIFKRMKVIETGLVNENGNGNISFPHPGAPSCTMFIPILSFLRVLSKELLLSIPFPKLNCLIG